MFAVQAIAAENDGLRAALDQQLTLVAREKRETDLTRDTMGVKKAGSGLQLAHMSVKKARAGLKHAPV